MCGITGFIDFNKKGNIADVKKMAETMPHRGPDGQHEYFYESLEANIAFGHRRLSIIDLSHSADQPMHYKNLSIVFNGEIYNYNEIREELLSRGHEFITHSDTEVILHSWHEWGESAIHKWRGMFAIVLLDKEKEEIICIRDRAGVKPFHYFFADGHFVFGSELKNLMAYPWFRKTIDRNSVASYFQYGYISAPYTIFENTHKLKPGHILTLNLKNKRIAVHQYWNVYDYYNLSLIHI